MLISIGALSEITGQRPSQLFDWNEPEQCSSRLLFDMHVINIYKEHEAKQMKRR